MWGIAKMRANDEILELLNIQVHPLQEWSILIVSITAIIGIIIILLLLLSVNKKFDKVKHNGAILLSIGSAMLSLFFLYFVIRKSFNIIAFFYRNNDLQIDENEAFLQISTYVDFAVITIIVIVFLIGFILQLIAIDRNIKQTSSLAISIIFVFFVFFLHTSYSIANKSMEIAFYTNYYFDGTSGYTLFLTINTGNDVYLQFIAFTLIFIGIVLLNRKEKKEMGSQSIKFYMHYILFLFVIVNFVVFLVTSHYHSASIINYYELINKLYFVYSSTQIIQYLFLAIFFVEFAIKMKKITKEREFESMIKDEKTLEPSLDISI